MQAVRRKSRLFSRARLLIQLRLAWRLVDVSLLLVAFIAGLDHADVFAHAAPALPPVFEPGPCVSVVDRTLQPTLRIGYRVPTDDTVLTLGDIPLPDSLTHQFFALHGSVLFEGFAPELRAFDPEMPAAIPLPLWISQRDVARAQQSSDSQMLGYDLSPITPEEILETETALSGRWRRITADDARVPITSDQSLLGITWNVRDVEPGLYTIAAYIFSPPYNGWEIRDGLVSIADGEHKIPAAVIGRIQESLFAGQGRRVRTCLNVPPGTRLHSYLRVQEHDDLGWMPWGGERSVQSGTVEQCLHVPDGLTGSVRLRADLIGPDGTTQTFYSPDVVSVLNGAVPCVESDSICCEAKESSDAASPDAAAEDSDATRVASDPAAAGTAKPDAGGGGCSVVNPTARADGIAFSGRLLLALAWLATRARHRRMLARDARRSPLIRSLD